MTRDHAVRVAISGIRDPRHREVMKLRLLTRPHLIKYGVRQRLYRMGIGALKRQQQVTP